MLDSRSRERRDAGPDPIASLAVAVLSGIAIALFVAAILAVYTYSTPAVELPLVIAIAVAFAALCAGVVAAIAWRRLL